MNHFNQQVILKCQVAQVIKLKWYVECRSIETRILVPWRNFSEVGSCIHGIRGFIYIKALFLLKNHIIQLLTR